MPSHRVRDAMDCELIASGRVQRLFAEDAVPGDAGRLARSREAMRACAAGGIFAADLRGV